jgi:outer membrane lipoprotein-sorting protein
MNQIQRREEDMKKILSMGVLSLFCLGLLVTPGFSQDIKEIRAKMIEASGGKQIYENLKDLTITGTLDLTMQGLSGSLVIYKKEPDKRRTDIEVMGMLITQAFDGEVAWYTNPQTGATEELSGDQAAQLKRQAMPSLSAVYPEKYGISWEYKAKETIEDKEYLVLNTTYPDGFQVTVYVDSSTYLTFKTKSQVTGQMGTEVEVEQFSSEYKKIGGMVFPSLITSYNDGEEYSVITIENVESNTGLEDAMFKMQ